VLGNPALTPAARDNYYDKLVDQAEAAGQLTVGQAVYLLKKKAARGAAELREWDTLLAKYAACFE